jgi:lysophospholipase L1-like esterase
MENLQNNTNRSFRVFLAGDSTMQYNDCTTYPQTGWGQMLPLFLRQEISVFNFAKNGRSTKSFINEGRLSQIDRLLQKNDYLLIQFGHNDEKLEDPSRGTLPYDEYTKNLALFADTAIAHKAYPLFLTSIARRKFKPDGTVADSHGEYAPAMIRYAKSSDIPVIDMNRLTLLFLEKTGEKNSRQFFMNFDAGLYGQYPEGSQDDTHLRYAGAFEIARIAAEEFSSIGNIFPQYNPLSAAVILPEQQ